MSLFTNGFGRPSNETIQKRNIFKGICVLLVLIIIGLVGYILNDKGIIDIASNDKERIITTTSKIENKIDKEALKIKEDFAILNSTGGVIEVNDGDVTHYVDLYNEFYIGDKLEAKNINKDVMLYYAITNIGQDKWNIEKVNNYIKKNFGVTYKVDDFVKTHPIIYGMSWGVNDGGDVEYGYIVGDAGESPYHKVKYEIKTKPTLAKKEGNKVIVEEKVGLVGENNLICKEWNSYLEVVISQEGEMHINDCEKYLNNEPGDELSIEDHYDELPTFRWTFTKNSEGKYLFTSVEKVK